VLVAALLLVPAALLAALLEPAAELEVEFDELPHAASAAAATSVAPPAHSRRHENMDILSSL
jgi:hypothetical protein